MRLLIYILLALIPVHAASETDGKLPPAKAEQVKETKEARRPEVAPKKKGSASSSSSTRTTTTTRTIAEEGGSGSTNTKTKVTRTTKTVRKEKKIGNVDRIRYTHQEEAKKEKKKLEEIRKREEEKTIIIEEKIIRRRRRRRVYVPPAPKVKITKHFQFKGRFEQSAFVQLYARKTPITYVDLDAQKHAKLTFRVFYPVRPLDSYDGWRLVVKNKSNQVVSTITRFGAPPAFIDWREIRDDIHKTGQYRYRLDLYKDRKVYKGGYNRFDAVEGLSVLSHWYLPVIQIEPAEVLGYFAFRDKTGVSYDGIITGPEINFVFWDRFILRGISLMSLHAIDPGHNFTITKVGGGLRFFGHGYNRTFGRPHMFRMDLLFQHTGFTVYNNAFVRRFAHFAARLEPHLVLWRYHYVTPWVEFGSKSNFKQQRFSVGGSYQYYIRPWSSKFGMAVAYDNLFHFKGAETLEWEAFRLQLTWRFFL